MNTILQHLIILVVKDPFTIQFTKWMVVSGRTGERGNHDTKWIGQFITEIE